MLLGKGFPRPAIPGVALLEAVLSVEIMLSTTLRAARPCVRRIPGRRFASHEAPQYNEPSGYLFGEKASSLASVLVST